MIIFTRRGDEIKKKKCTSKFESQSHHGIWAFFFRTRRNFQRANNFFTRYDIWLLKPWSRFFRRLTPENKRSSILRVTLFAPQDK